MIPVPGGVRVWLATGVTDMRRGMNTLALQVQEDLGRDPHAGDLYVFRGRRGDLVKILWADGVGTSLYAKRLERGRFQWPTPRGWAGPNLLASIVFEKYGQHQPLNRQRDRYAREGVDLSLSTLADQVGACTVALRPLHDLIEAHVMAAERLHGDDTPVPVLARGRCATGRAWVYVRDDRPFGGADPPAVLFRYSRDRSGVHPVEHLKTFAGILQADIYAGYNRLYEAGRSPEPVTEAACWAHSRRKFFELADIAAGKRRGGNAPPISPLALEAVKRIDLLFDIERGIVGKSAEERRAVRQELSAPVLADLKEWMQAERVKLSKHSPVAKAMDYMLRRWELFARFVDDGRICLTNNAAHADNRIMPRSGRNPLIRLTAGFDIAA